MKSYEVNPEESRHMEVAWTEYGEAVFHDICWKATIDSLKMDNPFSLSSLEKDIIAEAKKTAEYFDSVEKVKLEANRIASFLKSSNYAIAFTGLNRRLAFVIHKNHIFCFVKQKQIFSCF